MWLNNIRPDSNWANDFFCWCQPLIIPINRTNLSKVTYFKSNCYIFWNAWNCRKLIMFKTHFFWGTRENSIEIDWKSIKKSSINKKNLFLWCVILKFDSQKVGLALMIMLNRGYAGSNGWKKGPLIVNRSHVNLSPSKFAKWPWDEPLIIKFKRSL